MEFIKNSYFTDEYNPSDINSIFDYSKRLIGQSLSTICNDDIKNFDPNYSNKSDIKKRSGRGFGYYLEKFYFGYDANTSTLPDFPDAPLELKSAGLKLRNTDYYSYYVKKEPRLTLSTIHNNEIIDEEFETSSFFKKNKNLLIVFWLHDELNIHQHPIDKEILVTFNYQLEGKDYEIIKKDWEHIRNRIRDCEAHNLRNRETVNLESCGGEGKANLYRDYSKNNKNCEIPAKKKRFAYTKEFWNQIIDKAIN